MSEHGWDGDFYCPCQDCAKALRDQIAAKDAELVQVRGELSEANANFSEARTTANLYYQNIQAKEEIINSLQAKLEEAKKEVELMLNTAPLIFKDNKINAVKNDFELVMKCPHCDEKIYKEKSKSL